VRNPYYWKVDVKGNQLPYIDRLDVAIVPDKEVRVLEASQGKYTATFRASEESTDIPFLMDQAEEGGYHLHAGAVNGAGGWPCWIVNQDLNDQSSDEWEEIRDVLRDKRFRQALSHAMDRQRIIDVAWDGIGTAKQGTISPQSWHFADPQGQKVFQEWSSAYVEHDPQLAEQLLDEAGVVDVDRDGWRDLPSGAPFQLIIDVGGWSGPTISINATHTYADQLAAVGIDTLVNNLIGMPESYLRYEQGLFMLKECHASDLDVWVAPGWVFPSLYATAWPLVSAWLTSGGVEGVKPTGPARDLLDIYERGLAEPDIDRRHELVWEAIELHTQEGPFFIGASGDQQMPVVIADNFYGVPDLVVLGPWAPGSPGNLHPEQFWIDQ
jgi:peptide/nickel transport system substrate-binding protein